eukprot:5834953-Pleurochrysis_carterae.AAC.1
MIGPTEKEREKGDCLEKEGVVERSAADGAEGQRARRRIRWNTHAHACRIPAHLAPRVCTPDEFRLLLCCAGRVREGERAA